MKRILLIICVFSLLLACNKDEKAVPYLTVNPSIIVFETTGSIQKIDIISNTSWKDSLSNNEWCEVWSKQNVKYPHTMEIKVSENTGYKERIAYVTIENPDKTIIKTVKIIQKALDGRIYRQSDSTALVRFYDAMGGNAWTNRTGCKTSNLENWHGITVKNNRVTGIKMENNNLSGQLISEIGELTMLDTLSIVDENRVNGSIPLSITNLPNLVYLNISGTTINGQIPRQLGNLTSLKHLILSNNNFVGEIPSELAILELVTLWLDYNLLYGFIPTGILNKFDNVSVSFKICPQKIPPLFENYSCDQN
jgi:hypothetical protein